MSTLKLTDVKVDIKGSQILHGVSIESLAGLCLAKARGRGPEPEVLRQTQQKGIGARCVGRVQ